jgi:hypothetical protein
MLREHLWTRFRLALLEWSHTPPASSRHEIVLALAGASIMSGLGSLFGPDIRPLTVIQYVPSWVAVGWYLILAAGGAGLLISAVWRDRLDALLIEWPAYLMLGGGALVYGMCLVAAGRGTAFVAATGYLFYAGASLTRTCRILLYVNYLRKRPPYPVLVSDA